MDEFDKKNTRLIRIITIVWIVTFLTIAGFFIFLFTSPEKADNILFNVFIYFFIGMLLFTIFFVICGVINQKKYRQKLMTTKSKNICEYLDTFYYHVFRFSGDDLDCDIERYHILKDLSTSRIYAIPYLAFNNIKYVLTKNSFNMTISGSNKRIVEGTRVYFWKDKELKNWYERDNNDIIIGEQKLIYTREPNNGWHSSIETPKLYNVNMKYDISLLDKATFAYGYAEFDNN